MARSVLNLLRNRKSIRIFRPSTISEEVLKLIIEAGVRAPTYLQSYTIIQVKDEEKKEELAKLCNEKIVKNASAILLICADLHRTRILLDMLGHEHVLRSDKHPIESILAVFDAGLVVENMIIAAEALGLGSVILDCPLIECKRFSELFELPKGVTPLILLCIGERGEVPPLRPRLPIDQIFHIDKYGEVLEEKLREYLEELERHMEIENYVRKYAGMDLKYLDYLRLKTELTNESKKVNDEIQKFLKENLIKT